MFDLGAVVGKPYHTGAVGLELLGCHRDQLTPGEHA
jgi:hypothetical protein